MNIIERKLNDVTVLDLEGNLALEGQQAVQTACRWRH